MVISSSGASAINYGSLKGYMRNISFGILMLCTVVTHCSCSRSGCLFAGAGNHVQTRIIGPFHEIVLYDKINLILTQDSVQQISVEGDRNLLAGISTNVADDILTIKNDNHCNFLGSPDYQVNVFISTNQLQKITYYGAGNVSSTGSLQVPEFTVDSWYGTGTIGLNLNADHLNAYIRNNNAEIVLSGHCSSATFYCADIGSINALGLIADTVNLNQRSIRDIFVNVNRSLNAQVVYKGNVYYKGDPSSIDSLISNSGQLIHLN